MNVTKKKPDKEIGFINEVCRGLEKTIKTLKDSLEVSEERAIEIILKEKYNIKSYEELETEIENIEKKFKGERVRNKARALNLKVIK